MDFLSCHWLWIYAGALLMLLELAAPGFVLCFFGLAAATVGVCRWLFGASFDATWQLAAFSVFSILYIVTLRRWFKAALMGDRGGVAALGGDYVGRVGQVTAAIAPPLAGRVMLGDAEWAAEADAPVAVGANVKVISQNNLTMKVEVM